MANKRPGQHTYREIHLQAESLEAINDCLTDIQQVLDEVFDQKESWQQVIFTGCGSSLYLSQSAAHLFSEHTGIPARALPCSELYLFPQAHLGARPTLVVPVTRKSHTTEVRMAIDRVRALPQVKTLAITCDSASAAYNDYMLLSPQAGEESVVMTRSFTSMLYLALVMSLYVGGKLEALRSLASGMPAAARRCLPLADAFAGEIVEAHPRLNLYIVLGQGPLYGVANESMNKVKEMGLVNSEAYYSLEYRHGPMSLADGRTLILTLAHSAAAGLESALLEQMQGYGAVTAAVGDHASSIPAGHRLSLGLNLGDGALAIACAFLGQLLGYHVACARGADADTPRHLSPAIVL